MTVRSLCSFLQSGPILKAISSLLNITKPGPIIADAIRIGRSPPSSTDD